ncbi:MAG: hypothetical protein KDE31_14730, partial [Caldilineaceae bacterium]|nr:hypothetical protein [Caldilineaceae bacterium]
GRAHIIFFVGNGAPSRYELNGYHGWMVEATVTDAAGQSAVAYHLIEGTGTAFQFSLGLTSTTVLPNTLLDLHITSYNSVGVPDPYARMRLDLLAQQGPNRVAKGLRPVAGLVNADLVTDGAGELQLPVRFVEPGYYQLQLTHYDAKGYGLNPYQQPLLVYDPDQPWPEEP